MRGALPGIRSVQEFAVEDSGHTIAVEVDASPFITYRGRLFVDGALADRLMVVSGTFRLYGPGSGQGDTSRFVVEINLGFWGTVKRAELRSADGAIPLRPVNRGR